MKKVYTHLKSNRPTERALRQRLKRKKMAKRFKLVKHLKSAEMVVTSTADLKSLPKKLPSNVKLLQLTDCGGAQRYLGASKIEIANATRLFEDAVGRLTMAVLREVVEDARRSTGKQSFQLGIVGFGNIGKECLIALGDALEFPAENRKILAFDSIVITDLRPLQPVWQDYLRDTFDLFGTSLRWGGLDETLMSSDILIVAVHRGPTADPLLGAQEAELMDAQSRVIDLSEEGVVDKSAFDPTHDGKPLPSYYRLDEISKGLKATTGLRLDLTPKKVARFVESNLKKFQKGVV